MANLTGSERERYVQAMFTRIAHRYDLLNRINTAGQDMRWRREVIRRAGLRPGARLLDMGAGTGDLVYEALRQNPDCRPLAADFTWEMMQVGRQRANGLAPDWASANALKLPFPPATFDSVISGFLLRNVTDVPQALTEMHRVLKPGGRVVALDTTRPKRNLLYPLIQFHMRVIVPTLGGLLTGDRESYAYLPDSTDNFLHAEELADLMVEAGFAEVDFRRVMFGSVAIHWGRKGR